MAHQRAAASPYARSLTARLCFPNTPQAGQASASPARFESMPAAGAPALGALVVAVATTPPAAGTDSAAHILQAVALCHHPLVGTCPSVRPPTATITHTGCVRACEVWVTGKRGAAPDWAHLAARVYMDAATLVATHAAALTETLTRADVLVSDVREPDWNPAVGYGHTDSQTY